MLAVHLTPSSGKPPLLRAALATRGPRVADATAGMGGDAFDLAWAGCEVVAFERSPVAWSLLNDGLRRAAADPVLAPAAARITLVRGDARRELAHHGPFDVVVIDTMFEPRKESAGKRKSMSLLGLLAGPDDDAAELLAAARTAAERRVVVKRPARGPYLGGIAPSGSLAGRTVRFDLYAPAAASRV